MGVVTTDAKYHLANTPEKCLLEADRETKKMCLEACLQKCRYFFPFIASVDVLGEPKYGPVSEPQWKAVRTSYPVFYKALLKETSRTKRIEMLVADQRSARTQ